MADPVAVLPVTHAIDAPIWGINISAGLQTVPGFEKKTTPGFPYDQVDSTFLVDTDAGFLDDKRAYSNSYVMGADLTSGSAHFLASAFGAGYVTGQIYWQDELLVSVPKASATTITNIVFNFRLEGAAIDTVPGAAYQFSNESLAGYAPNGTLNSLLGSMFGGTHVIGVSGSEGGNFVDPAEYRPDMGLTIWGGSGVWTSTQVVTIEGPFAVIPVSDIINIYNITDGTLDFADTASFTVSLPPGVTATSASGVLLTARPATVPEAPSIALLGTGFLGLWMRRRKRPNA